MTPDPVTHAERIAAARARVVADRKRGVVTDPSVLALAQGARTVVVRSDDLNLILRHTRSTVPEAEYERLRAALEESA